MGIHLTTKQRDTIEKEILEGKSGWDIMLEFGVSKTTVGNIANAKGVRANFGPPPQWFIDRDYRYPGTKPVPGRSKRYNCGYTRKRHPLVSQSPLATEADESATVNSTIDTISPTLAPVKDIDSLNKAIDAESVSTHPIKEAKPADPALSSLRAAYALQPCIKTSIAVSRDTYAKAFADFKMYAREMINIALDNGQEEIASTLADLIYCFAKPLNA